MRNWLSIYRGLLGLSVKEYTRDPIPTIFTFAMPLMFLVIFGVTFMMVGPKGSGNSLVYKVGVSHAGTARARAPSPPASMRCRPSSPSTSTRARATRRWKSATSTWSCACRPTPPRRSRSST
jgi:hypothetical protein